MTQSPTPANTPDLSSKALVLATDLDGTFLGGSEASRARLYEWIEKNRDSVGLVFVTGRDPGFIHTLTREGGVPRPDYVVGDVGTTIASVGADHLLSPIDVLEAEIVENWGHAGARVQAALQKVAGDLERLSKTAKDAQINMERIADNVNKANLDRAALTKRVATNEEWIESINAFRKQVNGNINRLETQLRSMQSSSSPAQSNQ